MSDADIQKAIETFNKKLPLIPDGEDRDLCLVGLENFQNELARRAQKKSMEQSANQGQLEQSQERRLPTKEELQAWERGMEKSAQNQHRDQAESAQAFEPNRVVIARIENPQPITVPVVEMEFKDRDGNTYARALDQADILSLLKTYFKRVAVSPKMEAKRYSEAYGSDMGKMVYKLFQGWNTIYNETQEGAAWPPLVDCFPGMGRATTEQKVNAQVLWRWASNDK